MATAKEKRKNLKKQSRVDIEDCDLEDYLPEGDCLETFLRNKKDENDNTNRLFEQHYTNKLKSRCPSELWKKECRLISRDLSLQHWQEVTDGDPELCEIVENVIEEYKGLYQEAFLLLNVPKSGRLSYAEEKESRDYQLEDFCKILFHNENRTLFPVIKVVIKSYQDILEELDRFMQQVAIKAKVATIVFNGHGTQSGHLVLEDEQDSRHSFSDFIKDVHEKWNQFHRKETFQEAEVKFPANVTVVLAQSYSNLVSKKDKAEEFINIVPLATDGSPQTQFHLKRHLDGSISDSVHHQLHAYATERRQRLHNRESSVANNTTSDFQESVLETSALEDKASASQVSKSPINPYTQIDFIPLLFAWIHETSSFEKPQFQRLLKSQRQATQSSLTELVKSTLTL